MAELFDFFISGSVAHITTLGTTSDVSIAIGTGTIANIEIAGHEWEITNNTGTFVVANLNLIPLISSGGFQYGVHSSIVYSPFRVGQTLKDITELTAIYILGLTNSFYDDSRCEMSYDHIYLQSERTVGTGNEIVRTNAWNPYVYSQTYTPAGSNVLATAWCVYNNNTIYTMEYSGSGEWELVKVVFNPDDTQTRTVINSFPGYAFNGCNYAPFDAWYCASIKYGGYDVIVCVETSLLTSGLCPSYILRFTFYNVITNSITSIPIDLSSGGLDIDLFPYYTVSPSIYNGKLILTWSVTSFVTIPSLGTPYCPFPTFVADITDSSVIRIDDFTIDVDDPIYTPLAETSILNYGTEDYYFQAYNDADGSYNIIKMNLVALSLVEAATDIIEIELFQGYPTGYGIDRAPIVPDEKNVRSIPDMGIINTVNISSSFRSRGYIEGNCFIDYRNNLIWNLYDNNAGQVILQGKPLSSGTGRNILITNWVSVPWAYPYYRKVNIIPVAGQLVIGLFSKDVDGPGGSYTWLWYLLKENIPCAWSPYL